MLFTADEVRNMLECSSHHYDAICKEVGKRGGFLYGLKNQFVEYPDEEKIPCKLSFHQIDTLCKILEGHGADLDLAWKLKMILKDINEEWRRIAGVRSALEDYEDARTD